MKWKLLSAALLGLLLLLAFASLQRLFKPSVKEMKSETLTQKEIDKGIQEKITIDSRKKTVTRSRVRKAPVRSNGTQPGDGSVSGGVETKAERFERRAVITQDIEGNLHIWAPNSGAILEGGLLLGARRERLVVGIDGQLLYYKAWGLNIGCNALLRGRLQPRAYGAISYALPWEALSNTSVLVGIDTSKEVLVGVRVRL